jgi:hypothetical protein
MGTQVRLSWKSPLLWASDYEAAKNKRIEAARAYLHTTEIFFDNDPADEDYSPEMDQQVNFNDVWGWALSYWEKCEDEELPELAALHSSYGWCGVLYWCSNKNDGMRSAFADVNRRIEFVENEERIRRQIPGRSQRAYHQEEYTIGKAVKKTCVQAADKATAGGKQ